MSRNSIKLNRLLANRIKRAYANITDEDISRFIKTFGMNVKNGDKESTAFAKAWGSLNLNKRLKRGSACDGSFDKLIRLSSALYQTSLKKEAYLVSQLAYKEAQDLEGIYSLPDDDDEVPEEDNIGTRYDAPKKWYESIQALGTDVILIPFDDKFISEQTLYKLARIFGIPSDSLLTFDKLSDRSKLFGNEQSYQNGDLDVLKTEFPSLWSAISARLNERNIREDDAVYMLYNKRVYNPSIIKDSYYFAHDIGHIEEDFGESYDVKGALYSFLATALSLYIDKDELEELNEDNFENAISEEDFFSEFGKLPLARKWYEFHKEHLSSLTDLSEYIEQMDHERTLWYDTLTPEEKEVVEDSYASGTSIQSAVLDSLYYKLDAQEKALVSLSDVILADSNEDYLTDDDVEGFIKYFFDTTSSSGDHFADVYANALSGDLMYNRPDSLHYRGKTYMLSNLNRNAIIKIEDDMFNAIKSHISSSVSGPMSTLKGSVVLFEV